MSPFRTKKFKALERKWYHVLRDSGFEEAENTRLEDRPLTKWHSMYLQARHTPDTFFATQEYFRMAGIFLNEFHFKEEKDREIWSLHASGLPYREIAKKLRTNESTFNKDNVNKVINRLTKEMFEFTWSGSDVA